MKQKLLAIMTILLLLEVTAVDQNTMAVRSASKEKSSTVVLDTPSFGYYQSDQVSDKKSKPVKLKLKSSKTNNITDEEQWFEKNKISIPTYQVPNSFRNLSGNLPEGIASEWQGLMITSAFYDASYIYCTYGKDFSEGYILTIYDSETLKIVYSLDFSNYRYSPKYVVADYDYIQQRINWAEIKDNILYVSHSHNTYAKSSNNQNAYITAIDLTDLSILWRTKALVSNSYNFVILDHVIICGYGFTAEPDYLYQVDLNTGKVLDKQPIKTAASYIIKKGSTLYVRTYNTDYQFKIAQ